MPLNKINAKDAHIFANKVIAVVYAGLACWNTWATLHNTNDPGGILLALPLMIMAAGHFMYKEWALVFSSVFYAGSAVCLGLMVFTGLTPFDEAVPNYTPDPYALIKYFVFLVMPTLLLTANFYFYRKLGKMGSTAIRGNQSVVADKIKANRAFVLANRIIAVAYIGSACLVLWNFFVGDDRSGLTLFVCLLLILLALTMAAGHFKYQKWALELSGVISLVTLFPVIEFLINGYREDFGPKMYVQAMLFTLLAILDLSMMWNFYFYIKLKKSSRTTIRED